MLKNFYLTQSSLQDYIDCPRRFRLRYVLEQPWPAVETEPVLEHERHAELGRRFHQLVEQHVAGLPVEALTASIADPDLARWWRHYLNAPPRDVLGWPVRRAEVVLSAPIADYRLTARYDLLAIAPGRQAAIVDWKTGRRRPTRAQLAARLQTRVYRYVLVEAGHVLNSGQRLDPEQVEMIYWFAEFPAEPESFPYDAAQHAADAAFLSGLVAEIAAQDQAFPLTADANRCRLCVYRSLCERGGAAETSEPEEQDREGDLALTFDWTQIEEIAY